MKKIEDICFLIEAKANSERLPGKMYKDFCTTSLLDIAVKKFLSSDTIPRENIHVAAHGKKLFDLLKKYDNINVFKRTDKSTTEGASIRDIYEIFDHTSYKYFVEINACCPLLTVATIEDFVQRYISNDIPGLFGVVGRRTFYWNDEKEPLKECTTSLDTKNANIIFEAAHCLYAGATEDIRKNIHMGTFREKLSPDLYIIENEAECWDIDYQWQFEIAEKIYYNNFLKTRKKENNEEK